MANKQAVPGNGKPNLAGTIGDTIRTARKQAGLTQEQLAELAGIHRQWLGRWERGRSLPSTADWAKLRNILKRPANADR